MVPPLFAALGLTQRSASFRARTGNESYSTVSEAAGASPPLKIHFGLFLEVADPKEGPEARSHAIRVSSLSGRINFFNSV